MKRSTPLRAVVYDLDGTLIDSLPLVLESVAHGLEPYGYRSPEEIFAKLGGPPERFLRHLLDDVRHVPAALERMDAFHAANWRSVRPFENVIPVVERLKAGGVKQAIWTGRDRASGESLMRELRLEDLFDTVVYGDDLGSHKPEPAGMFEIMRRLGVTAAETLFVGDADVDVHGGAASGVDTVLIRHARNIDPEVMRKSWRHTATPLEALGLVWRAAG